MRYKILSLCVWIALSIALISSCAGVETPDLIISQKYPVSLSATSGEQTKVSLNGTSVGWESADILQITAVSQSGISAVSDLSVYSINETNDNIASFTGFVTMSEAPVDCYFTHPAGNAMTVEPSKGKIMARFNYQDGTHKPFLYSKESYDESGISTNLKYAGAMLEVDVQVEGVCSLVFFGNKFEDMFPLLIDPTNGSYSKSDEMGYQIQVPVQREGLTYICVPPVKLEDGFSIVLVDESGNQMIRSFSDGTGGYDFSDKAGTIVPIAVTGDFRGFDVSYSGLQYGHTTKDGLLSGTSISFKMDKSGVPDTRIEEWGATLVDSKRNIVRKYTSTDGSALNGSLTTLETVGEYKLLPAGEYFFTPYYTAFGKKTSFESRTIKIEDPGVEITLGGHTSYDKYRDGEISVANACASNIIYDLSASVNVHPSILDSYSAVLDGNDITSTATGTGLSSVSFGNVEKNSLKSYQYKVTVKVGNLTFEESRDFHITGLPMMIDFTGGSLPSGWGLLGDAKYEDKSVTFAYGVIGEKTSALRSPSFYLPSDISVRTSADASLGYSDIYLYVDEVSSNDMVKGTSYIDPYNDNKTSNKYYECSEPLLLTNSAPSLMYCTSIPVKFVKYRLFIYRVKIYYN